jgi:photosystem II stability/assembly factor-like uncharacterized protein
MEATGPGIDPRGPNCEVYRDLIADTAGVLAQETVVHMEQSRVTVFGMLLFGIMLLALSWASGPLGPIRADEDEWIPLNGPSVPGGTVSALALAPSAPNLLYAAVGSRVFKSDDAATSWTQVLTTTERLCALAVDPGSPQIAYAGGPSVLYKTDDDGLTWTQVFTMGKDVVIDPITASSVYVVGGNRVAKTTNGGANWTTITVEDASSLQIIAINPITPTILYAGGIPFGGKGGIILESQDGGLTWTAAYAPGWGDSGIYALEVDPQNPQFIYASRPNELVGSLDGGETWFELPGLPENTYHLALNPQHSGTVYAIDGWPNPDVQMFVSFDGGQSWWQSLHVFPAAANELIIDPVAPHILYIGLWDYGVYKSSNAPRTCHEAKSGIQSTWTEVNEGIRTLATVNTLAIHPADPDVLFAGSGTGRGGLFRSDDGGTAWTTVLSDTPVLSLAFNPVTPTTILAGGPSQLHKSEDGGASWSTEYGVESALSLAITPSEPHTAYAGGRIQEKTSYRYQGVVARQVPNPVWPGSYWWQTVGVPCAHDISALAVHPAITTTIFAGGMDKCGDKRDAIYRSQDGGLGWTTVFTNIGHGISDILFSPYSADIVFASGEFGIYKSTDGGETWDRKSDGLGGGGSRSLTLDALGRLYAGTREGVYWSPDGAEHWAQLGAGLAEAVGALAIRPGNPAQLLAGTPSGVWSYQLPPHFRVYLPIISRGNPCSSE